MLQSFFFNIATSCNGKLFYKPALFVFEKFVKGFNLKIKFEICKKIKKSIHCLMNKALFSRPSKMQKLEQEIAFFWPNV